MASNPPQAQRLRDALKQADLSRRRLAILLREQQPERTLENVRTQLNKWIREDKKGWSDETAHRLSAAFRAAGHNFPAEYFMKEPNRPQTWAEQMADLATRQDVYREELDAKLEALDRKVEDLLRQRDAS